MRRELMIDLRHLLSILKFRECFFYANEYHKKVSWWCLSCGQSSDGFPEGQTGSRLSFPGRWIVTAHFLPNTDLKLIEFVTPWTVDHRAPVHGILQARILGWVAIPFSKGSSQSRDQTWVLCIAGKFFYHLSHQEKPFISLGEWKYDMQNLKNIKFRFKLSSNSGKMKI